VIRQKANILTTTRINGSTKSDSFAIFAAIRRASSLAGSLAVRFTPES